MEEYGKKGLNVISITNESRETVLKYLAQKGVAPTDYQIGLGGGHGNYQARGIPASWLIGVDGKVLWQGHPGSLDKKEMEAELRKVKPTPESREAKAARAVEYADSLLAVKRYLMASEVLDRVSKEQKDTASGKKAAEKVKEMDADAAVKADLAAQKDLAKLVGGAEKPKEKFKSKEREGAAVRLESFIKKNEGKAGAVELAQMWAKVMTEDWKVEK